MISKLSTLIENGGSKEKIEQYEDAIAKKIEKYAKRGSFYKLPTKEILKIIGKSEINDIELLCELISMMRTSKRDESTLLLNVINIEEASLEECIQIFSEFVYCPLCKRISEIMEYDKDMVERDFEGEIEILKKENMELQKETNKYAFFSPVTEEPPDFESNICKAAKEGKLTSIQYLVEQLHADVETKNSFESTPINIASGKGHLEVVKYLYVQCHADIEAKDNYGWTPLINASASGHFEVVKYLYEMCHANVEAKGSSGWTPICNAAYCGHLVIVRYLYEICHADIEIKDKYGRTPIQLAGMTCRYEVIKYILEKCPPEAPEETSDETVEEEE